MVNTGTNSRDKLSVWKYWSSISGWRWTVLPTVNMQKVSFLTIQNIFGFLYLHIQSITSTYIVLSSLHPWWWSGYTLLAKKVVTPGDDVSFLWLFLFHQSARSKDRLFGVIKCFLCIWCPIFYSVVFCQFWRHLMIKWVIGRMCIPKCHWKIIVGNLVEQRWFFSWRCLVVSFCVCQVNIRYSRLSRR